MALLYGTITADLRKILTNDVTTLNGYMDLVPTATSIDLSTGGSRAVETIRSQIVAGVATDPADDTTAGVPVLAHTQTDTDAVIGWQVHIQIDGFRFPDKTITVESGATVDYSEVPSPVSPGVQTLVLNADDVWKRWYGTQAEYDALGSYDPGTLYVVEG